jgi:hypothetical protein
MSDDDHIRYMLDGGTRGLLEHLVELRDAWGFGGTIWIAKHAAVYKVGPGDSTDGDLYPLRPATRWEKTWFELDTGAKGWAVWFHAPELALDGRSLCGWVPPEREVELTKWLTFLNAEIAKLVANAPPVDPAEEAAKKFALTRAFYEHLGIPLPEAGNMDELVGRLEEASKADHPIDLRGKDK